jgi:hypothetical protein
MTPSTVPPFPSNGDVCSCSVRVPCANFPFSHGGSSSEGKKPRKETCDEIETHILTWKDNNLQRRSASKSNSPAPNKLGKEGFRRKIVGFLMKIDR